MARKSKIEARGEARDVRDFLTFGIVSMSNKFEEWLKSILLGGDFLMTFTELPVERANQLINHGPTVLVTSKYQEK